MDVYFSNQIDNKYYICFDTMLTKMLADATPQILTLNLKHEHEHEGAQKWLFLHSLRITRSNSDRGFTFT